MSGTRSDLPDIAAYMSDVPMCEAFLRTAQRDYADFLPRIRNDIARAMTGWLALHGYRAEVRWSGMDDCFVGQLRNTGEDVVDFHGKTPIGLNRAFERAVEDYVAARRAEGQSAPTPDDPGHQDPARPNGG